MIRTIARPFVARGAPREGRTLGRSPCAVSGKIGVLVDGLRRHCDEEHALVRTLGSETHSADENRSATLDAVVGVQLAGLGRVLAEKLEVDLDASVSAHLLRLDLQASRPGKSDLGLLLPAEIVRLLGDEAEVLEAGVLGELPQVLLDGSELGIGRPRIGPARRGDGAEGDAAAPGRGATVRRYGLGGDEDQHRPEPEGHCCTCAGSSSSTQIVVVAPFCRTTPSWFSKSISSMLAGCAEASTTGAVREGMKKNARA